jgi:hypothetical protein
MPAKTNGPALRESGPRPFYAEGCPINPHPDTLSWYRHEVDRSLRLQRQQITLRGATPNVCADQQRAVSDR